MLPCPTSRRAWNSLGRDQTHKGRKLRNFRLIWRTGEQENHKPDQLASRLVPDSGLEELADVRTFLIMPTLTPLTATKGDVDLMTIPAKRFPRRPVEDYEQGRYKLQSGDLLICSGSGVFSRMIQASTQSIWSHVGFVMRLDSIDRVMVLESVEPLGVRTVPLRKYLADYDSRGHPYPGGVVIARHNEFAAMATESKWRRFGQFAADLFGYPYDKDEIVKIAARIAASSLPFRKKDRKALQRDREYICSEYVWECYRHFGIRIPHDPRGFIAPADFTKTGEISLLSVLKSP